MPVYMDHPPGVGQIGSDLFDEVFDEKEPNVIKR